jgi:hypothetical protein
MLVVCEAAARRGKLGGVERKKVLRERYSIEFLGIML